MIQPTHSAHQYIPFKALFQMSIKSAVAAAALGKPAAVGDNPVAVGDIPVAVGGIPVAVGDNPAAAEGGSHRVHSASVQAPSGYIPGSVLPDQHRDWPSGS